MQSIGVAEITISHVNEPTEGQCLFDEGSLIGKTYIISTPEWEVFLHDVCFFHLVFTIRQYFEQNGIDIPEAFNVKANN